MPTLEEIKTLVEAVDPEDLEDAQVGDIYDIEGVAFKVSTVKPWKISSQKFAVELSTEEGFTFSFVPVVINNFELKDLSEFEAPKEKPRKSKNADRYIEIYEKSKTTPSKDLAVEYGVSYQMIRYAIKKAKASLGE